MDDGYIWLKRLHDDATLTAHGGSRCHNCHKVFYGKKLNKCPFCDGKRKNDETGKIEKLEDYITHYEKMEDENMYYLIMSKRYDISDKEKFLNCYYRRLNKWVEVK
jgi:hypothetical protein